MTSLFLIRRCHFSMATCLDVLNRKSVKSVSLRRAEPSDQEASAWAGGSPLGKVPPAGDHHQGLLLQEPAPPWALPGTVLVWTHKTQFLTVLGGTCPF